MRCLFAIALHVDTNESHELLLNIAVILFDFVMTTHLYFSLSFEARGNQEALHCNEICEGKLFD